MSGAEEYRRNAAECLQPPGAAHSIQGARRGYDKETGEYWLEVRCADEDRPGIDPALGIGQAPLLMLGASGGPNMEALTG
jgi:hypothetical protein